MAVNGTDLRPRLRRQALGTMAIVIAAAIVLVAAARVSGLRMDLTEDGIYTLSDATRSVLAQLDEPLMIRAYITKGLPQPYGRLERFIRDMLQAYHDAGGGKVGFEVVDPASDPNVAAALAAMNIPKVRVQVVENDQAQVKQGYLAIVLEYLDRKETLPVIQGEEGFEYLLTRKIKKITGKGRAKIGVAAGFGAHEPYRMQRLQEMAGDDYEFVTVRPDREPIPDDVRALIVAGVSAKPDERFRYRVDRFVQQGRGLIVLASNVIPMLAQGFAVRPVDPYANDWIRDDLGVAVDAGLVMDRQASRIVVNQREGMFLIRSAVDYPFVIRATALDSAHPVTRGLESVTVPFAAPLVPTDKVARPIELVKSSEFAAVQSGPGFNIDPLVPIDDRFAGLKMRRSLLAVAWEGPRDAAFTKAPEGLDEKPVPHAEHTRWIVVGSSEMLDDEFLDGGNIVFALNALDWLAGDEGLIALRSRGVTDRPLMPLSPASRQAWKALWMFGLPLLVVIAGLARWLWLRRGRGAGA